MKREDIFLRCVEVLHVTFNLPKENIRLDSRLYEDLGIDSIDAVDLIVQLKPLVGRRLRPEDFKHVRTLDDVVTALDRLISEGGGPDQTRETTN